MKKVLFFLAAAVAIAGCKGNGKTYLPSVSGKAGEIIVVMEKTDWEGSLGNDIRGLLACDCPYLAQKEPLYSLVNVIPSGFADLFKVHRNILIFNITPQADSTAVYYKHDVWASPQCVIQIDAQNAEGASRMVSEYGKTIISVIEQAERDRVIRNSILYEERADAEAVRKVFPGSPHFPSGYKIKKVSEDFIWIADEKQYTMQGIFMYRYPAEGEDIFNMENIIARRNEVLQANVPGMFENTYMTTSTYFTPMEEFLRYKGRDIAQVRGMWEVENDFMGGPFVSHSFYSKDGSEILVLEAFVYAPRFDKRQYLRQVESILFSWDWNEDQKAEE